MQKIHQQSQTIISNQTSCDYDQFQLQYHDVHLPERGKYTNHCDIKLVLSKIQIQS